MVTYVHAKVGQGRPLSLQNGPVLKLANWQWPGAARAQALLQQGVMQAVVGGADHAHGAANQSANDASRGKVLMVSYQPKPEAWVKRAGAATAITF